MATPSMARGGQRNPFFTFCSVIVLTFWGRGSPPRMAVANGCINSEEKSNPQNAGVAKDGETFAFSVFRVATKRMLIKIVH